MRKGESGLSARTPIHISLNPADESLRLKQSRGGGGGGLEIITKNIWASWALLDITMEASKASLLDATQAETRVLQVVESCCILCLEKSIAVLLFFFKH